MMQIDSESVTRDDQFFLAFKGLSVPDIHECWKQPEVASCNPGASPAKGAKVAQNTETFRRAPFPKAAGRGANMYPATKTTAGRESFEWDRDLPGFGVRTQKSGRQVYIIQYRERGRTRRKTLGVVGTDDRRKMQRLAKRLLTTVDVNHKVVNPFAVPANAEKPTLAEFIPRFWQTRAHNWKPRTQKTNMDALQKVILPAFGHLPLDSIARSHVVAWRDGMSNRPGTANRALPVLSAVMKTAEELRLRRLRSNPCQNLARLKTKKRLRFLSLTEVEQLGATLARYERQVPTACDIIRLLLLTGARKGEIESLRWQNIDGKFLHLPDSKTGPSTRYLGSNGRAILDRRRPLDDTPGTSARFVFDAEGTGRQPRFDYPVWQAIREAAGIPDVRLHDLRHTYASHAVMNGVSLSTVSRLLGHALLESTEIYLHLSEVSVREASNRVGGRIARLAGMAQQEVA